jgi:predicted Fe-Mo cluster-binding NifX family protein
MKVAISIDKNKCSEHFGRCEKFNIYEIENGIIIKKEEIINPTHKFNFLPGYLKENEVDIIIANDMGRNAQNLFNSYNIKIITGVNGFPDKIIELYLKGDLKSKNIICTRQTFKGEK